MLRITLCLFLAVTVAAQEAPAPVLHGSLGVDFTNAYFFRGIVQEDRGVIAQPWVEFDCELYEANEGLRGVDLTFGLWNSLHDGPTGGNGGAWYESDFYVGLGTQLSERVSLDLAYVAYHSPNGTFGTIEELMLTCSLDDSSHSWLPFGNGLQPSVTLALELDGQADGGSGHGAFAQIGIEPEFELEGFDDLEASFSVPISVGLSLNDYYEAGGDDDVFGFLDIGVVASAPLSFLPPGAGPWQGSLGVHWLLLGDHAESYNGGDSSELILSIGLSTTF